MPRPTQKTLDEVTRTLSDPALLARTDDAGLARLRDRVNDAYLALRPHANESDDVIGQLEQLSAGLRTLRAEGERRALEVPVTAASTPSLAQLAAAKRPGEYHPQPAATTRGRWELHGTPADIGDPHALAERMLEARRDWSPDRAKRLTVATLRTAAPDSLSPTDWLANTAKIARAVEPGRHPETWDEPTQALVASGGWCAPAHAHYATPALASAERPFRDSMPSVPAERGTVNFVRAPRLASILANQANAAITTWETVTDEVPGESTKTRQTIGCSTIREEEIGAVVARIRMGNFRQKAHPEEVASQLAALAAMHARVAERRLLDSLIADVNIDVAQTGLVGTSRDLKHHLLQAAAEIRFTERLGAGAAIRAALSDVAPAQVAADIALQQASGSVDALMFSEADARRLIASAVNPVYVADTPTGADAFITNSDNENLADWPDNFEIPVYPLSSVAFADGGELNLGWVRDANLNDTNDVEMFYETFEGLLWLGPYAKTLTLTTCPNGDSQIASDLTGALCSGS